MRNISKYPFSAQQPYLLSHFFLLLSFLVQFFQLIHTKFIVLVAELAVDFDALALVDHLLQLLAADADQRLFYTALGAVAGKLNRHLIQNLQTKLS